MIAKMTSLIRYIRLWLRGLRSAWETNVLLPHLLKLRHIAADLISSPIEPSWIVEGNPIAQASLLSKSSDGRVVMSASCSLRISCELRRRLQSFSIHLATPPKRFTSPRTSLCGTSRHLVRCSGMSGVGE